MPPYAKQFTAPLLDWFVTHGRKNLPWQHPPTAYRVWVSEIMLQQTQVKTVIAYFERFIQAFPDVTALAQADEDAVLALWSGLGYYSRARNLQLSARIIIKRFAGELPRDLLLLTELPGIGPSTAAAICSLAYHQPTAILDGNVKRILARYFLVAGYAEQAKTKQQLMHYANQCMSRTQSAAYTQAIMDLGATLCTPKKPQCANCPLQTTCKAHQQQQVMSYPQKKPQKTLAEKQQQFFLLYTDEPRLYLEKRPPAGIWGGLWCLPTQLDNHTLTPLQVKPLLNLVHTFSHFKLHIEAIACQINRDAIGKHAENAPGLWLYPQQLRERGLAKPVQDIIQHFLIDFAAYASSPEVHPVVPHSPPD